jgi:hypothetical protein
VLLVGLGERSRPGLLVRFRSNRSSRKVAFKRVFDRLAAQAPGDGIFPTGDVQDKLPNRVSAGDWLNERDPGVDAGQGFVQGWTVPGRSVEGAGQLIGEAGDFAHSHYYRCARRGKRSSVAP